MNKRARTNEVSMRENIILSLLVVTLMGVSIHFMEIILLMSRETYLLILN